ncbi:MAG TPA: hypothetical protein VF017_22410 [Thermoanaerobaculia bacterium]|nr:hypothetical protein [Thermoanaerobaculia bacterium]
MALAPGTRLLVTVLSEPGVADLAVWSEDALAVDWLRPEEEKFGLLLSHDDQAALTDARAEDDRGEEVDG